MRGRPPVVRLADLLREDHGLSVPHEDADITVRCPWHADTGFSLLVNPVRGRYRCTAPRCAIEGDTAFYLTVHRGKTLEEAHRLTGGPRPELQKGPPGRSAIAAFKRRARVDVLDWLGQLLMLPVFEGAQTQMWEALLPTARGELQDAAAAAGFRVDWSERVLVVWPYAPGFQALLEAFAWFDFREMRILLEVPGARRVRRPLPRPARAEGMGAEALRSAERAVALPLSESLGWDEASGVPAEAEAVESGHGDQAAAGEHLD